MSDNVSLSCTNSLVTIMVIINHRNIPRGPICLQPLAACDGALDGRPDSRRRAARAAANVGCSTGTVAPGAGTREACGVEDATPSVISTSSTRTMGTRKMMKCDQLAHPLPGAPNVVVLQTTAGWRKAPALAQR